MRAILMNDYGGPEVLQLGEAPMPEPAAGEVRVKTAAIGVNPADWKRRSGWFRAVMPLSFPHIPGSDVAGTVDAVGGGVDDLRSGDRIALLMPIMKQGAYAEYVVAPANEVSKIPDALEFASAAALPTPGLTGVQLIEEHIRALPGQTVLVTGAVGAVGRVALYTAQRMGIRVVAAVRARQAAEARALGAEETIVLGEDWHGAAFDAVADTVGGPDVAKLCRSVKPDGVIATVSTTPIDPAGLPSKPIFVALHSDRDQLARLAQDVARGKLTIPVAKRLPLERAAEAHRLVEAGGQGGKVVIEP